MLNTTAALVDDENARDLLAYEHDALEREIKLFQKQQNQDQQRISHLQAKLTQLFFEMQRREKEINVRRSRKQELGTFLEAEA